MSQMRPQTVVITGSTSGIGRSIAFQLAHAHFNVVLNYSVVTLFRSDINRSG